MAGYSQSQQYGQIRRSSSILIAGILMAVVGFLGLLNSYLILASAIILGWLIVGFVGIITLAAGIALLQGSEWAYSAATSLGVLNLFIGFIALLGALNYRYRIIGWVGIGQAVGVGIFVLSAIALFLLYREGTSNEF
jgi:hypothetical protein